MQERVKTIRRRFDRDLAAAQSGAAVAEVRVRYLGRKSGVLTTLLKELRDISPSRKASAGKAINTLKSHVESALADARGKGTAARPAPPGDALDLSLPGRVQLPGCPHPISQIRSRIEEIFLEMGYALESGPLVETDYYNFEALNIPQYHPARDMQDTFYVEGGLLLRTHTSPVQIRTMQRQQPPVRMIALGMAFRRDAADLTHSPVFHQVEGLAVDERITFADLRGTLEHFCRRMFDRDLRLRFRPSYFPFVEPGAEYDISCIFCGGDGCRACKGSGWIEIGGAGMVHPAVFENVGYDPERYTGFAFGLGLERIAMLKHGIDDIRLFYENDVRFLSQFPA
ncbi:MAG: phenylalanine--tRNA ligase subunit alpha [Acidobacteriota bacterium]